MKNPKVIIGILVTILLTVVVIGVGIFLNNRVTVEQIKVSDEEILVEYLAEQKKVIEYSEQEKEVDDAFKEYINQKYEKPEEAIKYLFALALSNNVSVYTDAFTNERIEKDILNKNADNPELLIESIYQGLTRNNTLVNVEVVEGKQRLIKDDVSIVVALSYSDLDEPIYVRFMVKQIAFHHEAHAGEVGHNDTNYYYIDSSIWDVLEKIEEKGGN